MKNWIEQLQPIIDEYKDGDDTPLDGDSVDKLILIIKSKIDLQEGNITEKEYDYILDCDYKEYKAIQEASKYLCNDDMGEAIELIKTQAKIDQYTILDNIEGVTVWDKLEYTMTAKEFLYLIY